MGTLYKQVDPFTARKRGASLVVQNIARHLHTHFADKGRDYTPLIYCWRGGQRSASLALVLSQMGWRAVRRKPRQTHKGLRVTARKRPLPMGLIAVPDQPVCRIGSPFLQGVGGDGEATPAQTFQTDTDAD